MINKFNAIYKIERMNRNSLTLIDNAGRHIFIHRNAYNAIVNGTACDFREVERIWMTPNGGERTTLWIEVCVWSVI